MMDDRSGKLICPAGNALYRSGSNFVTKDGYIASSFRAPKRACRDCQTDGPLHRTGLCEDKHTMDAILRGA